MIYDNKIATFFCWPKEKYFPVFLLQDLNLRNQEEGWDKNSFWMELCRIQIPQRNQQNKHKYSVSHCIKLNLDNYLFGNKLTQPSKLVNVMNLISIWIHTLLQIQVA